MTEDEKVALLKILKRDAAVMEMCTLLSWYPSAWICVVCGLCFGRRDKRYVPSPVVRESGNDIQTGKIRYNYCCEPCFNTTVVAAGGWLCVLCGACGDKRHKRFSPFPVVVESITTSTGEKKNNFCCETCFDTIVIKAVNEQIDAALV